MSACQPPASQQSGSRGGKCRETPGSKGGSNAREIYHHSVTQSQAALLSRAGSRCPLREIQQKTGADVQFDVNFSPVQDTKTVIIRGSRQQIEETIRHINQETGAQGSISAQAETFWLQWVEAAFPDVDSRAYFLPPVYFNRVPMTKKSVSGQDVCVLHSATRQAGHSATGQGGQISTGHSGQLVTGQSGQITTGHSDQLVTGQSGQTTMGHSGQLVTGQSGQITMGHSGQLVTGQSGQITTGHSGQLVTGQSGQITTGHSGQLLTGQSGQITTGHSGQLVTGQSGQITTGHSGQLVTGQSGQITTGHSYQLVTGQSGQSKQQARTPRGSPQPLVQDSDVRDDAAMQRVLFCLQKMSETNGEVMVGLSQLQFGQYLGEPCYAAAAAHLPLPASLPPGRPPNWKRGDFDVLLIHRQYGLVICEVKTFGDNVKKLNMSPQDIDDNIRKKLTDAVLQLDKAEAMLTHLVSDIAPGLRITKTIAVPNLSTRQVQQAISSDAQLTQDLCRCLGTKEPANITGLCLCSDQLSDPKTPWDISSDVLRETSNWWQRRVAVSGPETHLTCDLYKELVARFCGPATTVTLPCASPPRLCVKTLGQAVSLAGECYTAQITLFPEQADLLDKAPSRLFVAGPPGTGKTVVLQLMATEWLRRSNDVFIVSTWWGSRAPCHMLYYNLQQAVNTQLTGTPSPGQPHLRQYNFYNNDDVKKAVMDLSQSAKERSLYVIADEAVQSPFQTFYDKLLAQVDLHLWVASCYHGDAPAGWQVEFLTRPLRSPPAVVREVQLDKEIADSRVQAYSERGVADHTDGPPVRRLYHRGQGHSYDCVTCGREVAGILLSLRVGGPGTVTTSGATTTPCLQWKDMLVLYWYDEVSDKSGVVTGLREAGIPVRMMTEGDTEDVATGHSDVVWMAYGHRVRGLERKVVVCLDVDVYAFTTRLHVMSRCTSQLVIVSIDQRPPEHAANSHC